MRETSKLLLEEARRCMKEKNWEDSLFDSLPRKEVVQRHRSKDREEE